MKASTACCGGGTQRRAGFTLIEVLIVFMLMAILVTAALPGLNSSGQSARFSGAVDEVHTALSFAGLSAMNTGRKTRVTIDAALDTIRVEQWVAAVDLLGSEGQLSEADVEGGRFEAMTLPMNPGNEYTIWLGNESRFDGVTIVTALFGTGNSVVFDMLGKPSSGGSIALASGGSQVVVSLDGESGKVTVVE